MNDKIKAIFEKAREKQSPEARAKYDKFMKKIYAALAEYKAAEAKANVEN